MILVDTSVWIEHLRKGVPQLEAVLEKQQVLVHPFILGELACGNLVNRREVLDLLAALPAATVATHDEALLLIERRALTGRGIGLIDVHLLASAVMTEGGRLWSRDRRLSSVAAELKVAFSETLRRSVP